MASSSAARMRDINAAVKPRNTLNQREPSAAFQDARPTKRLKPDGPGSAMTGSESRYFTSSTKSHANASTHDLTRPSPSDIDDSRSVHTPEKATDSYRIRELAQANERSACRLNRKKRKSRKSSSHDQSRPQQIWDRTGSPMSDMTSRSVAVQSPDILSSDDHPPAANIVSDVHPQPVPKATAEPGLPPLRTRSHAKKPENVSDDELLQDPNGDGKRNNNFTKVRQPRTLEARGDIQPTVFKRPQSQKSVSTSELAPMEIEVAVCGSRFYESDGDENTQVFLRRDDTSGSLVPVMTNGDEAYQQWLHVNVNKVQGLQVTAGGGPYVILRRASDRDKGSILVLTFTTVGGASTFASTFSSVRPAPAVKEEHQKTMQDKARWALVKAREHQQVNSNKGVRERTDHNDIPWERAPRNAPTDQVTVPANIQRPAKLKDGKLKDGMRVPASAPENQLAAVSSETEAPIRSLRNRRDVKPSSPPTARQPSPIRWTRQNPEWRKDWQRSLVFPATGKNRATVDNDDIVRLDEGEFLNDNLISFYLRYLQVKLEHERPEVLKKVHIFSTFFFEKLRSTKGKINYEGVKTWTAKFDLFSYDYILVPVNERAHWYLAIICNVPYALNGIPATAEDETRDDMQDITMSDIPPISSSARAAQLPSSDIRSQIPSDVNTSKVDPRQPKVITLDSLGSQHYATCRALKEYLIEEARDKKKMELALYPNGMKAKEIPEQNNFCDCGVFVLAYVEEFLKDPDAVARKLLLKEDLGWKIDPPTLRNELRELIFGLQREQQHRLAKEKEEERKQKLKPEGPRILPSTEAQPLLKRHSPVSGIPNPAQTPPVEALNPALGSEKSKVKNLTTVVRDPACAKDMDDQVRPLKEARDSSSSIPSVSSPNEAFFSAQSSPKVFLSKRERRRQVANLEAARISGQACEVERFAAPITITDDEPRFISPLASSPTVTGCQTIEENRKERDPSLEIIKRDSHVVSSPPQRPVRGASGPSRGLAPSTGIVRSIESPPTQSEARYDGIDRSREIDLT